MKPLLLSLLAAASASAALVEKTVEYEHDGVTLEGFHVYDDAVEGKRPAVLVIHQWTGLTDYEKHRSRMLAEMGYNVLAADIYGAGVRPQPPESGNVAGIYKNDRALLQRRARAALEALRSDERTDPKRIGAIGYCFGGMAALELARSGADLTCVVSFHGSLDTPSPAAAGAIKAKVLVLHGANDPHVPIEQVNAFENEMRHAGVDWELIKYGGAVHAFTQPSAGNDPSKGAAYHAAADQRSWQAMQNFFNEVFSAG